MKHIQISFDNSEIKLLFVSQQSTAIYYI